MTKTDFLYSLMFFISGINIIYLMALLGYFANCQKYKRREFTLGNLFSIYDLEVYWLIIYVMVLPAILFLAALLLIWKVIKLIMKVIKPIVTYIPFKKD